MPIVDVHTHMFTRRWLELLRARATRTGSASDRTVARRSSAAPRRSCSRSPATSTTTSGSRAMDEAGIDVSIVSLTCPNVYWGGEEVSTAAARESNDIDGRGPARVPGPDPLVRLAPVGVPGSRDRGARPERPTTAPRGVMVLANVAGREPDRVRLRADLGRDRPAGAAGPRPSGRAARRRPDGHGPVRPQLVGRVHVRHHARVHPDDLRRLPRSVPEPQADRGPRRRRPSRTSSGGSRRATRWSSPSAAG